MTTSANIKVLCATCKRNTNHETLYSLDQSSDDDDSGVQAWSQHQVVKCCGCDEITFRVASECTEDIDYSTGKLITSEELYPSRAEGRAPMDAYHTLPTKTRRIYSETLKALNQNAFILSAIGLRAVIESICAEQSTTGKTLKDKIDELASSGLLSTRQAEFLHTHRFMGNAAAHEMLAPKPDEMIAALDIAETLLKTIYVLPEIAESIKPKAAKKVA